MSREGKAWRHAVRLANVFAAGDMQEVESLLKVFVASNRLARGLAQMLSDNISPRPLRSDFGGEHNRTTEAPCPVHES